MRVHSRELFVGFLLVLGLVAGACQPVQSVSEVSTSPSGATVAESEPITDSATLVESGAIRESGELTENVSTVATPSETVAVTVTAEITATSEITAAEDITGGAEVSGTTEVSATEANSATVAAATDPATLAAGLAVYRAQYCGVCHTLSAAETRGTFGPPHDGLGATAAARLTDPTSHGKATTAAEYIHESIVDPQAFSVPGYATTSHRMPSYAHLDAATLDALVAFLLAQ
jgi:mono/diheme cytochrome c family protein